MSSDLVTQTWVSRSLASEDPYFSCDFGSLPSLYGLQRVVKLPSKRSTKNQKPDGPMYTRVISDAPLTVGDSAVHTRSDQSDGSFGALAPGVHKYPIVTGHSGSGTLPVKPSLPSDGNRLRRRCTSVVPAFGIRVGGPGRSRIGDYVRTGESSGPSSLEESLEVRSGGNGCRSGVGSPRPPTILRGAR